MRLEPGQSTPWLDLVRRCVRGSRIEIVPGAGHFTMIDAPEACNRLLSQFIADVG